MGLNCYVYVLKSKKTKKYYIGSTRRLRSRIKRNNKGYERYTKTGIPWLLVVYRRYDNELDARLEEKRLKNLKGNSEFKMIIRGEMLALRSKATT